MVEHGLLTILPPLIALTIALWKRKIIPALFIGGVTGEFILSGYNKSFLFSYLDRVIDITGDRSNLQLIVFSLLIGALVLIIEKSNGFKGFILLINGSKGRQTKKTALGLTWAIGLTMFLENWSNILINGTTIRPLYEKLNISKEEMAYYIHTISINTVALVIINSWGAFYISLLQAQGIENPFNIVLNSVPLNFYCIISLIVVAFFMVTGWKIGKMKKIKEPGWKTEEKEDIIMNNIQVKASDSIYMIIPILVMIVTLILSLFITGNGKMASGDGTGSVFYAVVLSLMSLVLLLFIDKSKSTKSIENDFFKGIGDFVSIAFLIAFSLTLGKMCMDLGTGEYIARITQGNIPDFLISPLFFLLSCVVAFSTGTSYGTFSIMIPLAMPTAFAAGINPSLIFAACISGGVFGDNTSPFSDTTIITSLTAKLDVVRHVETQIPYALLSAGIAGILFMLAGILM